MNGQVLQCVRLVCYVKNRIRNGLDIPYKDLRYEKTLSFTFLPDPASPGGKHDVVKSAQDWCRGLQNRNLSEIWFCLGKALNIPDIPAFGIMTVYADGRITRWLGNWEFAKWKKKWQIRYTEVPCDNIRKESLNLDDPAETFKTILPYIEALAAEISSPPFASLFRQAYRILSGEAPAVLPDWMGKNLVVPDEQARRLLAAAATADVFGGMGSWNDVPAGYAEAAGRGEEYRQMSRKLAYQVSKATMYAVNTCTGKE